MIPISQIKYRFALLLLLIPFLGALFIWYKLYLDPSVIYLDSHSSAEWIKHSSEFKLNAKRYNSRVVAFKTNVDLSSAVPNATITLRSLRQSQVFLDGKQVFDASTEHSNWKLENTVSIGNLTPGQHELIILVMNYDGPPVVQAFSRELGLKTDLSWESNRDGKNWSKVMLASEKRIPQITKNFQPTYSAFINTLPYGLVIFFLTIITMVQGNQPSFSKYHNQFNEYFIPTLRWFFMVLWILLAITSIINHPLTGADYPDHLYYIHFILNNGTLPTALDGIQTFQSPLYYLLAAAILKLFFSIFDVETSYQLLKIINLLCGLAMVEICYRCVRLVFPGNIFLQFIGLVTGALFPMNLYMSQFIGNEQLAATFSALTILLTLKLIKQPDLCKVIRYQLLLGLAIGLGLLAKVTVVLLIPPSLGIIALHLYSTGQKKEDILKFLMRAMAVTIVVAGWYYLRNWILLGKPFIGGWDPEGGIAWWQDPGYRTFEQFTSFGTSLLYPIYSSSTGFWDGFYSLFWVDAQLGGNLIFESRPRWNYSFMLSLPLLSIIPTLAMMGGLIYSVKKFATTRDLTMIYLLSCVLIYISAMLYLYLHVPIYGSGKAVYAMGLIPVFTILCTLGFSVLENTKRSLRIILTGLFTWWAAFCYISFFTIEHQDRFSHFYLSL